jgi:predicted  nucleic acid-binding Zn-ribbon protein
LSSESVLEQLAQLQQVSDEVDVLEAKRNEAQSDLERINASMAVAQERLETIQQQHRATDMERRKREVMLKEEKDRQQRIKGRIGEVKTSREYQAVQSETTTVAHAIKSCEDELFQHMEALEKVDGELTSAKESIQTIEADASEAQTAYDTILKESETEISTLKAKEKETLKALPNDIAGRYKMIRSRRGGLAVVEARDEACTACHINIPSQTYIEVVRKSKVVMCPNCHRILIPPSEEADEGKSE